MVEKQITFRIKKELWEALSIKAIKQGKTKTRILIEMIEDYVKG